MPGNKVEDRIYNFCKLDNSSHCQILPPVVDSEWPVLFNGDWVWKQQSVGQPWIFDAGNYNVLEDCLAQHDSDSLEVSFDSQQLISRPEFSQTTLLNNQPNTCGFMFGSKNCEAENNCTTFWDETCSYDPHSFTLKNFSLQKSHQEYASVDSPTLTANSERSVITETSSDLHYLGGPQHFGGGKQQHNISLSRSMHQPGFNDMQYLPQHVMLKQLQELHGQQQIQQLGDARQQSSLNQFYAVPKQGTCPQDSALLDGIPVDDPPQIFINRTQRETFSNAEGLSNRFIFSQDQGQAFFPTSLVSQQLDGALYGTPTSSRRGTIGLNTEFQGMGHAPKSTVPTALSKPLLHGNVSMNQDAFFPEGSSFKQGYQGKNVFERGVQGLEREVTFGNFQLGGNQTNTLFPDVLGGQDVANWPEMLVQKKAPPGPSLDSVPLDPIEEKILYNMEDNSWDASFGRQHEDGAGGFGSWSALMQSAVAEASNSDTGIHEWSGLAFQNTEVSTDNHPTNLVDREKLRPDWIENNLQGPSSLRSDSVMGYRFSQQQQIQLQQREHLYQENSHESAQKSFGNTGEWLECNSHLKPLNVRGQQAQPIEDLNSPWADQIHEQSESDTCTYQHQTSSYNNVSQRCSKERDVNERAFNRSEAEGFIWKIDDGDSQQLDYMKNAGLSMDEENETGGSNLNKMSNGSIAQQNSYDFSGETFLEGKHQRGKSYNAHLSSISSQHVRHMQQPKYFDDFSSNAMKLDEGFLTVSQRNTRALDKIATEGDLGASINFSFGHNEENISAKISHNMLELLPKVDQSKDNSSVPHYHSPRSMPLPMITEEGVDDTLVAQPLNLMSTSQGCALGLVPSSQRQSTPNRIHSSYMPLSMSGQQNIGLGDKSQTLLSLPFGAHAVASNELSQNAYCDDKSNLRRQTSNASSLLVQGNSVAGFTHPQHGRNQLPMQVISKGPSLQSSAQASFPGMGYQSPVSNLAFSQEISHQPINDNSSEQYPVLEAQPVFRRGMDQPGELSMRQENAWKNKLTMEANTAGPFGQASNDIKTTVSFSKGLNSQISQEGESERKITSANFEDASDIGEMASKMSNSKAIPSFSLLASARQQELGEHFENKTATASETVDVRQIATMSQQKVGVNQKNVRLDASSLLSSDLSNFIRNTGENPGVLSSLQPPQEKLSGGSATFGQIEPQTQYGSSNLALNRAENAQINPHLVPSWFKQYGAFRNGQMPMPSMYNPLSKAAVGHLPLANPSVDLHKQSFLDRVDSAHASQSDQILHGAAGVLTANDPFTAAPFFTADVIGQNMAISRPNKRKCVACDLLPWHEEVKQGSKRILSISMVEQAWAESTNRLMEKVGDEYEMVEDGLPMYRAKRRLILTTQLMQHLLLPAPAMVFSADVSSVYDSVTYFVARLSLGDACSLIFRSRKDYENLLNDEDSNLENLKAVKTTGAHFYANVVESFSTRAQKLENDLLRLDKALSITNLRVECQELERFSVINRFAKFHIRQADGASSSGFSANVPKTCPQRYVSANPMPRNLPEGMPCISL